jgi:hypothetical protein
MKTRTWLLNWNQPDQSNASSFIEEPKPEKDSFFVILTTKILQQYSCTGITFQLVVM